MSSVPAQDAPSPGVSASAFAGVFEAVQGLRNQRAVIALMGCLVVGVVVAGALAALSGTLGFLATFLALIVWVVAAGTGINAAGLLQMDHARGISPRSLPDALVAGLMCIPKLIALGILLFLVEIAVFIVIAIALAICKIPFLGPVLFTVVLPVSVVVAGLTVVGLFVCGALSLPAIWQGASIMRALSQTLAIARSRTVEALLLLVAIWFVSFVVGFVMFGILGAGLLPVLGMSGGILGFGGGLMGGLAGMGALGGGGGIIIAGGIGMAVLWAVVMSLVMQVYLLGLSIVYLRVTEGIDLSAAEAGLRAKLDEAKRRASEMGEKARAAAQAAAAPTPAAEPPAAAPYMPAPAPYVEPPAPYVAPPPPYVPPPAPYMAPPAPPPYVPPPAPVYAPPAPAPYQPPPVAPAAMAAAAAASFVPVPPPPTPHLPPADSADIDLSFDDLPPSVPPSAGPPAYSPPVHVAPSPQPAPEPVASACPQCLSPITPADVFCGVCGYRLK